MNAYSEGKQKIEWVISHMPILNNIDNKLKEERSFKNVKIGMALHLEAKTAYLSIALKNGGADIRITSCNPLSSDDSVIKSLHEDYGVSVYGKKGESDTEYWEYLHNILDFSPDIIIDDGADLISLLHREYTHLIHDTKGANEETTTGIVRLKAMEKKRELKIPVIDVNDASMKHLFDNRYGTGQSTFDGIFSATNLTIAGSTFVVAGYGWCGRGIAMRAKGLGAEVVVTEIDPVKAIEARMDGFSVMPMKKAVGVADFIVTATGCKDVVSKKDLLNCKNGAVLANAGHFNKEVSLKDLDAVSKSHRTVRRYVDEYVLENGKKLYLLGEGRLINLVAGQGHPAEIMDMSFSLQALSAKYLLNEKLKSKIYPVPAKIDRYVAMLKLKSMGIKIDHLTKEQKLYLSEWDEGT